MVSLRLLLVQESQRGYSPFSNTYCSPLQLACSYPTHLIRQNKKRYRVVIGMRPKQEASVIGVDVLSMTFPTHSQTSLFFLFLLGYNLAFCLSLTLSLTTHGPHSTSMEPTFSTPASWRLLQGPVSSWQRPWKFSCS